MQHFTSSWSQRMRPCATFFLTGYERAWHTNMFSWLRMHRDWEFRIQLPKPFPYNRPLLCPTIRHTRPDQTTLPLSTRTYIARFLHALKHIIYNLFIPSLNKGAFTSERQLPLQSIKLPVWCRDKIVPKETVWLFGVMSISWWIPWGVRLAGLAPQRGTWSPPWSRSLWLSVREEGPQGPQGCQGLCWALVRRVVEQL